MNKNKIKNKKNRIRIYVKVEIGRNTCAKADGRVESQKLEKKAIDFFSKLRRSLKKVSRKINWNLVARCVEKIVFSLLRDWLEREFGIPRFFARVVAKMLLYALKFIFAFVKNKMV